MAIDDACLLCEKVITDSVAARRCSFCIKLACPGCHVACEACCEVFCVHCSMVNYAKTFGRVLCLDCDRSGK
jgi:hypothetical protein